MSEGIRAVDERMSKQEDIRGKKVQYDVIQHVVAWTVTDSTLTEGTIHVVAAERFI